MTVPPVTVREPLLHTSDTRVPKVERDLVGEDQTSAAVMLLSEDISEALFDTRAFVARIAFVIEVEALCTCAFVLALIPEVATASDALVFELTDVIAEATCELVLVLTEAALEAVSTAILDASDDEALCTSDSLAREPDVSVASVSVRAA